MLIPRGARWRSLVRRSPLALPLALVLATAPAGAQMSRDPDLPMLLTMASRATEMRYTPGALDRAAHLQVRLEGIAAEFQRIAGQPFPLVGWVLARDEWRDAGLTRPFGVPQLVGAIGVAVPAWGDDELVQVWRGLLGDLPVSDARPLLGTMEEISALSLGDALAQLEIGRVLVRRSGMTADQPWVLALAAHLAARVVFERLEPGRWPELDALMLAPLIARGGGDAARPIGGYSESLPLTEGLWYEAQFARGADAVFAKEGVWGSRRLLKRMIHDGAQAGVLLGKVPALADWRAHVFAP